MFNENNEMLGMEGKSLAYRLGLWLAELGTRTESEHWDLFVTITFRTTSHPWRSGFPAAGSCKPSPEFGAHAFDAFVCQVEAQIGHSVEFVVVDQFGRLNGRFHQHAIIAGQGLNQYPRREMEAWLLQNIGFSRVLPYRDGAAFYMARFAGNDDANLRFRIGKEASGMDVRAKTGCEVAVSAELPKSLFHATLGRWHR
jgi:hypothetical protein